MLLHLPSPARRIAGALALAAGFAPPLAAASAQGFPAGHGGCGCDDARYRGFGFGAAGTHGGFGLDGLAGGFGGGLLGGPGTGFGSYGRAGYGGPAYAPGCAGCRAPGY